MNKLRRGVESLSQGVEVNSKTNPVGAFVKRHLRYFAASAAAVLAFGGAGNEAKADTETVDDIFFEKNLHGSGLPILDMNAGGFTLENGGVVEINQNYSAKIRLGSNKKDLEFIDNNTGNIVETHTFSENLSTSRSIISLGDDFFILKSVSAVYIFNGSDIGTPSGVTFRQSVRPSVSSTVTHLNKHPQTGQVVGATLAGGMAEPAVFFSYGLGDFAASHPIAGSELTVNEALSSIGALNASGQTIASSVNSSVIGGNIVFAVEDASGNYKQWINPESDEVVLPTPVITAPAEFSMNQEDLLNGKSLELNVSDVPHGGIVKIIIDGVEFEFADSSAGVFTKTFIAQELVQIGNGEFNKTVELRVEDESGVSLASEDMNMVVDIVAPNEVEFSIDGAVAESMNGVEINVVERESVPAEVTLAWMDGALDDLASARVAVAAIPLFGITMEDFTGFTDEEQRNYVLSSVEMESGENGTVTMSGSLGYVKDINDLSAKSVNLEVGEGGHIITMFAFDEAGNFVVSIETLDVRKVDNSDMTCAENPDQVNCETPEETCEENPTQAKCEVPEETCVENPDQVKCETPEETCEENPDQVKCEVPEEPVDKEEPEVPGEENGGNENGGSDEEGGGCSTVPGKDAPVDGGLALAALGMLGLAGAKRRKKKKPESQE